MAFEWFESGVVECRQEVACVRLESRKIDGNCVLGRENRAHCGNGTSREALRLLKKDGEVWDRIIAEEKEIERAKRAERIRAEEAQADQSAQDSRAQAVEEPVVSVEKKKPIVSILRKKFGPRSSSASRGAFTNDASTMTDGGSRPNVAMNDAATMTDEEVGSSRDEVEKEVAVLRLRVAELEVDMAEVWYQQEETRRSLVAMKQKLDHQ